MTGELPAAIPDGFYRRVNRTLEAIGFAREVWAICEPACADPGRGGRPGIDPVVYLKMLTVALRGPAQRACHRESLATNSNPEVEGVIQSYKLGFAARHFSSRPFMVPRSASWVKELSRKKTSHPG